MDVSASEDVMKIISTIYDELKAAYKRADVDDQNTCKLLMEAVKDLITIPGSLSGSSPKMLKLVAQSMLSGQIVLNLFEISKRFFKFVVDITSDRDLKQSIDSGLKLLGQKKRVIETYMNDLGDRVIKQLFLLKRSLAAKQDEQDERELNKFIGEFDYYVHMMSVEIQQCLERLSKLKTKINDHLKQVSIKAWGGIAVHFTSGIGVLTTLAVVSNPGTMTIGAGVFMAGYGGGILYSLFHSTQRHKDKISLGKIKELEETFDNFKNTLKKHVVHLQNYGVPVADIPIYF